MNMGVFYEYTYKSKHIKIKPSHALLTLMVDSIIQILALTPSSVSVFMCECKKITHFTLLKIFFAEITDQEVPNFPN